MKILFVAAFLATSVALPAFPQSAPPATVEVQSEEIPVPETAPKGSSGPMAVGVGSGVAAVVIVFGIIALGSVATLGASN